MLRSEKSASATKSICIIDIKRHLTFIPLKFDGVTSKRYNFDLTRELLISLAFEKKPLLMEIYAFLCHVYLKYQDVS